MTNQFNIVVADIGELRGLEGSMPTINSNGQLLASEVVEQLNAELKAEPQLAERVTVLYDKRVGMIDGDSFAARGADASALATSLNADVVIYGYLMLGTNPAQYIPQFYISPRLTGAEELTGENAFGQPINVRLPLTNPDNRARLEQEVTPRFNSLSKFMISLAYFNADDYERAADNLQSADRVEDWDQDEGKEILHLWAGTIFHQLARVEESHECWFDTEVEPDDPLRCARSAYENAIQLDSEFARAYIGLGNLWTESAERNFGGEVMIDCSAYDLAIQEYQNAMQYEGASSPSAFLPLKSEFNIGLTYATAYRNGCEDGRHLDTLAVEHLQSAESAFLEASENYPEVILIQELGSRVYYQLGVIYSERGDYDLAAAAFTESIEIAVPENPDYEEDWQSIRWKAQLQRGNARYADPQSAMQDALNDYEAVLDSYRASRFTEQDVVSEAFYQAGTIYEAQSDVEGAWEYYTEAAALPDANPDIVALADQKLAELEDLRGEH